jgi:hypothetical protein
MLVAIRVPVLRVRVGRMLVSQVLLFSASSSLPTSVTGELGISAVGKNGNPGVRECPDAEVNKMVNNV